MPNRKSYPDRKSTIYIPLKAKEGTENPNNELEVTLFHGAGIDITTGKTFPTSFQVIIRAIKHVNICITRSFPHLQKRVVLEVCRFNVNKFNTWKNTLQNQIQNKQGNVWQTIQELLQNLNLEIKDNTKEPKE